MVQVGCDNVHIHCAATDVNHVMNSYQDGGWDLQEAKSCLDRKCILQSDGRYVNADEVAIVIVIDVRIVDVGVVDAATCVH